MIIVLHSNVDLAPITVIDLPIDAYQELNKEGAINLKIKGTNDVVAINRVKVLDGLAEIYVAAPETAALALCPAFLPGQRIYEHTIKKYLK